MRLTSQNCGHYGPIVHPREILMWTMVWWYWLRLSPNCKAREISVLIIFQTRGCGTFNSPFGRRFYFPGLRWQACRTRSAVAIFVLSRPELFLLQMQPLSTIFRPLSDRIRSRRILFELSYEFSLNIYHRFYWMKIHRTKIFFSLRYHITFVL
jgi:hypothetical protein